MRDLAPEVRNLIERIETMAAKVEAVGPANGGTFADLRAAAEGSFAELFAAAGGTVPTAHREEDHAVGDIAVRVYTPEGAGPFPAVVHVHGGAWMMGSIDWAAFRAHAADICERVPCVVVAVEYRLAPEHPFPTAVEDAYASLLWLAERADELDVDPERIAVAGDSAGANIVAAVCLMARDRGGPPIVAQLLEVPAPDHAHLESYASATEFGTGYGLETETLVAGRAVYFADPRDALDPYASPLLAEDLSGLPPAHILTAELDPLRDGGEAYGRRLADAGVAATVSRQLGHIHGSSLLLHPGWEPARAWRDETVEFLRGATRSPAPGSRRPSAPPART